MADFDFLDDFGISASEADQPKNVYDKFIIELSNKLAEDFRDYTKKVASNTGALASSIIPVPTGQLSFRLDADEYYPFVDEGVNAVGTNNYGSQFSFRYPGVSHNMATAISQWKGLDMSHAYAVASNIKQRGLRPKRITDNVITNDVLNKIALDLAEVTGLMFEITFDKKYRIMAITIYDEPQLIAPAGNPLVFTFSSDQTAQPNFSFVVELYIDSQLRLTQEVFRQFNTLGRIDVSEAVQSAIRNPEITTDLEFDASNSMVTYAIIVYEKYGTTPIVQASDTSTTLKAFNGALEYPQWRVFDYEIYDPNLTQDAVFLTNFPTTSRALCGMDENFYLGYFEQTGAVPVLLNVFLLDIQGNTIASDTLSITSSEFNILNVGPQVIIANSIITQNDFDDCFKYEVAIDVSGVSFVGPFTIYMDTACKRYETYRLHWLNKLGSWDSFTFALVSTESATVQAFDYQRDPGVWNGTSYTYPLYSGQKIHYAKTKSKQLILNSDWISESVQNWLVESLFDSPLVYLEQNNGTEFEPVKVTNTSYQLKTRRRDGLIQEQITIDRTYTYRSQLN